MYGNMIIIIIIIIIIASLVSDVLCVYATVYNIM